MARVQTPPNCDLSSNFHPSVTWSVKIGHSNISSLQPNHQVVSLILMSRHPIIVNHSIRSRCKIVDLWMV